ncbi:MAG: hypothetical protein V2I50_05925 [Desulfuromusa sp.]|jgi:uncharacterized membrane protein YraQ (UPF0718 family)|nr:hypothetical protein [Desulfuromusa sp.]
MKSSTVNQLPIKKKKESAYGAYIFLLCMVVVYLVVFFLDPVRTLVALRFCLGMLKKLLPVLGLVSVFMLLNNLLVKPNWVRDHVGRDSGWRGVFIAVVAGILSMGPIYVWYGILQNLREKGMRTSLVASFLYARSVKPQLLPLMIYYFGWLYALVLVSYLIVFSVLNGLLTERFLSSAVDYVK